MRKILLLPATAAMLFCAQPAQKAGLVVCEKIAGKIGFFDAAGKCLSEVKVGVHPHEMVLSADRRLLYVTDNGVVWMTEQGDGGNSVSIIDVPNRKNLGTIDLGPNRRPHGIDIDPVTGNLLVTTEKPSGLLLVDPRSRKILKRYDVKGEAPHMVLLGPDRRWAFVSNTNTGTLAAVNVQTSEVTLIPTGSRPQGTAFSPDRKTIYVTNADANSITVVDVAARKRVADIATGQALVRLVVTPDGGTLIYALQLGAAVGFADVKTGKEVAQIPLPGQPVSLTLSADRKHAYSSVQAQDKIFEIPIQDRRVVRMIDTPKGSGPDPVYPIQ